MRAVLLVVVVAAACGDNGNAQPPDAAPVSDAAPADYPACREFATEDSAFVPAHVEGALAGSDLASPSGCAVVDAPYGSESAGPDQVVRLRGLHPGQTYVVRLRSESDLQFYVTTGCGTPSGPGAEQCLLFQDSSISDGELGRFVATAAFAYVVVDFFASETPPSMDFALDVYAQECEDASQCNSGAPACSEGHCVECASEFDCTDPLRPRCDGTACVEGDAACTYSADTGEPFDDGPAGARVLAPDASGYAAIAGDVCSKPRSEADYIAFDVATVGEIWDFQLAWTGGRDLDVELFDAHGTLLGMSFWEHPERARLTYLAAGRYYLRISEFVTSANPVPAGYTVTAQRTLGTGCMTAADCGDEFRNQLFRGSCVAGACVAIDGDASVAAGGACDSQSDCAPGLRCPSFFFVANGETRETCNPTCDGDADCATGFVCTSYLAQNFCVPRCTSTSECPTAPASPPITGPWYRLVCNAQTGHCLP